MATGGEKGVPSTAQTLLLRGLPAFATPRAVQHALRSCGASNVVSFHSGRLAGTAYALFASPEAAQAARTVLEGGKKCFGGRGNITATLVCGEPLPGTAQAVRRSEVPSVAAASTRNQQLPADAVAPKLGLDYPRPPHLEYHYPKCTAAIAKRIGEALLSNKTFYAQVLHLMLVRGEDPPFLPATHTAESVQVVDGENTHGQTRADRKRQRDGGEEAAGGFVPFSMKRRKRSHERERVENEGAGALAAVASALALEDEEVVKLHKVDFEALRGDEAADFEGKKEQTPGSPVAAAVGGGGSGGQFRAGEGRGYFLSVEDVRAARLSGAEMRRKFPEFVRGSAHSVLFVSNVHAGVLGPTQAQEALRVVFGAFCSSEEEAHSELDVRVLGDVWKGQAFVKLPSVRIARRACEGAHGYLLDGVHPLVVSFANPKIL